MASKKNDKKRYPKDDKKVSSKSSAYKGKHPAKEETEESSTKGSNQYVFGNDPRWYAKYPFLVQDTARPPFNIPLGTSVEFPVSHGSARATGGSVQVPSVFVINYVPFCGGSDYNTVSPANAVALKLWTAIRRSMSGSTRPYDAPDIFMYVMAMSQINAWFYNMRRAYGLVSKYSTLNRAYPRAIVEACGFDFDDLKMHLADFRAHINSYSAMLQAFGVPAGLDFISRQAGLCSRVFVDDTASKFQAYVFRPEVAWWYDEVNDTNGTCLRSIPLDHSVTESGAGLRHSLMNFEDVVAVTEKLVTSVILSEDCGTMNADLLKAYGELYTIPGIEENFETEIMYDPVMLSQIQNATFVGRPSNSDDRMVKQLNGVISNIANFVSTTAGTSGASCDRLLACPVDNPDPLMIMESTRLTQIVDIEDGSTAVGEINRRVGVGGAEVCTTWQIGKVNASTGGVTLSTEYDSFIDESRLDSPGRILMLSDLSEFNSHPIINLFHEVGASAESPQIDIDGFVGNTMNWTTLSYNQLYSMHYTAINSLFDNTAINVSNSK